MDKKAKKPTKGFFLVRWFKNLFSKFKNGSLGTKLSFIIPGIGNLLHKQIIKGLIFIALCGGLIAVFILSPKINNTPFGFEAFGNLVTLGTNEGDIWTQADDSRLMLLFGVVTIGLVFFYIFLWLKSIDSSYIADEEVRNGKKPSTFKEDIQYLLDGGFHKLMLTPTIIAACLFTVLPTIFMIMIAFTSYDATQAEDRVNTFFDWVGLANFRAIFGGNDFMSTELSRFWAVLAWTIIWAVLATFTCYFGGILLALLINKKGIKLKGLWRTIFVLTIAMPQFISLLAVRNLLGSEGPFNHMLMTLGITKQPIEFLGADSANPNLARFMVIMINLWIGIPYTMLQTSGILLNIPSDLYEAATIDGASKSKMFTKITLPYILFITGPYLISSFVGNITSFNIIYLLTGGGPVKIGYKAGETDLLVTWLYKLTIDERMYNVGSVIGIMTFIITSTITLFTYRRSKSFKSEDAFQ